MRKLKKPAVLFTLGGFGYAALELLWRGRTHWSMVIAGGLCFIMFSLIAERFSGAPLVYKAVLCSLGVTAIELVFGVIFNLILDMNVWDYSKLPFNFLGQICLLYSIVWGCLAFCFVPLADFLNRKLKS